MTDTTDPQTDFDGCNPECRRAGKHTLRWGGCEQAVRPEPTVSMSKIYTDPEDGYPSIGFDAYTVPELARLIEPAVSDPLRAVAAARAIVHRNDDQAAPSAAVSPPPATDRGAEETTVTANPDGGVILHLPEITYLDTQVWAADIGLTDAGLRSLADAVLRRLAAGERDEQQAQQGGAETGATADKAEALGMTPAEYRAHCHRTAEEQIRTAARGLYADAGIRVLAALDLSDGPVRCPLCPYPVTLHTPNGARAHFTTVHPEQRITGRGPGPWPLLVTDGDEAQDGEVALLRLTVDAIEEGRRELRSETARLRAQLWTLAAALDGLHTLIATSSRDWQTYRVDAWLWAVLCGWDCEEAVHDETCTHGALEETAAMHGWDDDTVAKARRYRAAVRALTDTAAAPVAGQPPADTGGEAAGVCKCPAELCGCGHGTGNGAKS